MLTNFGAQGRERGFSAFVERKRHDFNISLATKRLWFDTFNSGRFNPQAVWQLVSDVTLNDHFGPGKHADRSQGTYDWFHKYIGNFDKIDAPSAANFILEGRHVLLNAYQAINVSNQQRQSLSDYYSDLVNSEHFKAGWEHIYRNTFITDLKQSNPMIISSLVRGLQNKVFGAVGDFPLVTPGGEHLFVTEYKNFLRFLSEDTDNRINPQVRGDLIKQVQDSLLPRIRMSVNPRLDDVFTDLYTTSIDNLAAGYGLAQANKITVQYNQPKSASTEETQTAELLPFINQNLDQLEQFLTDPGVGIGGKRPELVKKAIKLFDETVTAISQRHDFVQGVFFDAASERLLKILDKTKDPVVRQMYEDLVNEKLIDGQKFMAFRKLDPEKAGEFINLMLDRIDNQIYGEGGEQELTDVFVTQVDRFLEEVGGQSTLEQHPVYEAMVNRVKTQIATKGDTKKSKALAKFYDKAIEKLGEQFVQGQKEYMFNTPADISSIDGFSDAVAENLASARQTLHIDGDMPAEVIDMVVEQTRQAFLEAPIREVWAEYIDDISNQKYGEGASVLDLSQRVKTMFGKVKETVRGLSPEKQYYFYKVGKEQLIATLRTIDQSTANHIVIVNEFNSLVKGQDFEKGKAYEKERLMTQADLLASKAKDPNESRIRFYTNVWENYLDTLYDPVLKQGAYTSIKEGLETDFENLIKNLSTADFEHTGAFLRAGYTTYINKLKSFSGDKIQGADERQRMVFAAFKLLSWSEIASVMDSKENEFPTTGIQGAKSVRTLGRIQVEFINDVIYDRDTLALFFPYIETSLKKGLLKNQREERLCVTMLYTYRDTLRKRLPGNGTFVEAIDGAINLGFAPEMETLLNYQGAVTASLESSTHAIEKGHMNAYLEVLAAIGDISPYTLVRLAGETNLGKLLKNTRKYGFGEDEEKRKQVIMQIKNSDLSAEEKFYMIYAATGKMDWELDTGRQLRRDQEIEGIINGATRSNDGIDLMTQLLTYRDDVCQTASIPGLQAIMGNNWEEGKEMVGLRRSIFEKYFSTAIQRIKRETYNKGDQLSQIAATELLALSMMLESNKGEDDRIKNGNFVRIYSDLLIDIITSETGGAITYSKAVKDMAWKVLNYSLPYWSQERVEVFVDSFADRVKTTDLDGWIEGGNWKKLIKCLAVVDRNLLPLAEEAGTKNNIRRDIAKIVVDHTLNILEVYDVLGGRSALKSPIDIMTNENSGWPAETVMTVAKSGNFIEQAIGMVSFIGVEETDEDVAKIPVPQGSEPRKAIKQKTRLKEILEELARRDNLRYAWKVDMMPEYPAADFLSTSEKMLKNMRTEVTNAETSFSSLLANAVSGSRTFLQVDDDGRVIGMADKPKLVVKIEAEGKDTLNELIKEVKLEAKALQTRSFAQKQMEGLESLDGEEFVDMLLRKSGVYSGDDKDFKAKLMAAVEKFAESGGNNELNKTLKAASGVSVNVDRVAGFGAMTALQSKMSGINGLQGILEAYLTSDKAFGANLIKDLLEKSGTETTVQEAELIRQVILKGMTQILTDENSRQEAVMGMRRAEELSHGQDLLLISALRNKYIQRETGMGERSMAIEMDALGKELDQLEAEVKAKHEARGKIVSEYEKTLPEVAGKLGAMQTEYVQVSANNVDGFFQWLKKVSSPSGPLVQRTRKYAAAVITSHDAILLTDRNAVQLDVTKLMPTPKEILGSMGLFDAYRGQLPESWAV